MIKQLKFNFINAINVNIFYIKVNNNNKSVNKNTDTNKLTKIIITT